MALTKNPKFNLKLKYFRIFQISLIVSLLLIITAFKFFPRFNVKKIEAPPPQVLITTEPPIVQMEKVPPPPLPKIIIENPTDEQLPDIEIAENSLDENAVIQPPTSKYKEEDEEENIIFIAVEDMPEPIGGINAIRSRIQYPEIAKRAGIEGRVYVRAFVDETGKVFKTELIKGIGGGCDEVALEAVATSLFKPGKQRGKPVKVQVTVPILFKLQ